MSKRGKMTKQYNLKQLIEKIYKASLLSEIRFRYEDYLHDMAEDYLANPADIDIEFFDEHGYPTEETRKTLGNITKFDIQMEYFSKFAEEDEKGLIKELDEEEAIFDKIFRECKYDKWNIKDPKEFIIDILNLIVYEKKEAENDFLREQIAKLQNQMLLNGSE